MKKGQVIIFCLIFLLSFSLIVAQDLTITPTSEDNVAPDLPDSGGSNDSIHATPEIPVLNDPNPSDFADSAKDAVSSGFGQYDESRALKLPLFLQKPLQFLFAIKDKEITLDLFMILLALFIGLYVILHDIMKEFTDNSIIQFLSTFE